jgi:hypothetical protein
MNNHLDHKIRKYAYKFNNMQSLKYIVKFIQYKKDILNGGFIDDKKQQLIRDLQNDINQKCKRMAVIPDIPFEEINHLLFNTNSLVNLLNLLILKKSQSETHNLLKTHVYKIIQPYLTNIKLNEQDFMIKDYSPVGLLFTLFNINETQLSSVLQNIITITIDNKKIKLNSMKEQKSRIPDEIKRNQQIKIIDDEIETLNNLIKILMTDDIFTILIKQYMNFIKNQLIIQYDSDYIKHIIIESAKLCNPAEIIESGKQGRVIGQKTEDAMLKLFNPNHEYDDVLYNNILIKNASYGMKGELDLVIGDFDKINKTYDITDIYDIKNSAHLINKDIDKFNSVVDFFSGDKTAELSFDKTSNNYTKCGDCTYNKIIKGYIYLKPIEKKDKYETILIALSIYINKMKDDNNITELNNIFHMFKLDSNYIFPFIDLSKLHDSPLRNFIVDFYKRSSDELVKKSSDFVIYQCLSL